jgi:hypothetical protein
VGRSWGACICYGNFCGLESQVQVASQVSGTGFLGMSRSMEFACISRTGRCRGWGLQRWNHVFHSLCLHLPAPTRCLYSPVWWLPSSTRAETRSIILSRLGLYSMTASFEVTLHDRNTDISLADPARRKMPSPPTYPSLQELTTLPSSSTTTCEHPTNFPPP